MTKVLVTAEVEDTTKWEAGFRTHADLFRDQSISKPIQFTTHEDNQVGICFEPENVEKYLASLQGPETAEAMAIDGVKRDTVKIFVLDKEMSV
jgi:hypothetical protein